MFATFGIKLVPFGNMGILSIACIIFFHQLRSDYAIFLTLDPRLRFTSRLYLVFEELRVCVGSSEDGDDVFYMAIRGRNENFLKIFEHFSLPAFTYLAGLAIHEGRPHFVTAFPANAAGQGQVVRG